MSSHLPGGRLSPGQRFADRFEVLASLGEGGMGAVYRARDLALGEVVALKVLAPQHEASSTAVLRFRQEVRLARKVTHPNVVRVFDIGEHDGRVYLTMEIVEGATLSALLRRRKRLSATEVASIGAAMCEGLGAAHAAGVVHRDLKPSNILIAENGRVALTDFGIAQGLDEASNLTQEGMVVGTLRYIAPEQLRRKPLGPRTDVFALGLVLHEMLAGDLPERTDLGFTIDLRREAVFLPAEESRRWEALLSRCLQSDPAQRFADANELGKALGAVSGGAEKSATTTDVDDAPTTEKARPTSHGPITAATSTLAGPISVLPFQYVGPEESAYLGRTIADELVDTLAQIRGLRVLGTGATAPFVQKRDPFEIGKALGAAMVLDGTLQMAPGGRTRMVVRLLDAATGMQRWSARHEGAVADLFSFQASIARVIAEKLRVELTVMSYEGAAPPEAIEHYLAARRDFRSMDSAMLMEALASFERCLHIAPGFVPAVAGHAMATVRAWFVDRDSERDRAALAMQAVAHAQAHAPNLPETHFAAAMLKVQEVDFAAARRSIDRALTLAPTYVDALEYLGMLLSEAGAVDAAFERLRLAMELDPNRPYPHIFIGRMHALLGRHEEAMAMYTHAEQSHVHGQFAATMARLRLAAWRGEGWGFQLSDKAQAELGNPRWLMARAYGQALSGQLDEAEAASVATSLIAMRQSARAVTTVAQLLCEIWLLLDQKERAFGELARACNFGLIDLLWLDRCALLAPLRELQGYAEVRRRTVLHAQALGS
jgi:eukaryotic-like serine/threonine-protein kinase